MTEVKYAWCGYWNGVCKAAIADLPDQPEVTEQEVLDWIRQGAEVLRRVPVDIAREELRI